jgi:2-oxoglutarate decarboxylase
MSSVTQTYGANTAFIEDLYESYRANPDSVSASWREFFQDYEPRFEEEFEEEIEEQRAAAAGASASIAPISVAPAAPQRSNPATLQPALQSSNPATQQATPQPSNLATPQPQPRPTPVPSNQTTSPLRGAAGTIAQNMELSLSMPTETSIRYIPV